MLFAAKKAMSEIGPISVAPMMAWTDRHDRYFLRKISKYTRLYTEMVTADAIRFGPRERLLGFDPSEQPIALQIGGSDPGSLAEAAHIGASWGYDEINLNVGCPSDRVQSGKFGAVLMLEPELVARCVAAMMARVTIDVTVKCRIGVDEQDPEHALFDLVRQCKEVGVTRFIVHARKAWLQGLSPKENRERPPLDYEIVYRLKARYPELNIVINGGIETLDEVAHHLQFVDGVMLGRAAYKTPYILSGMDGRFYNDKAPPPTREDILEAIIPYAENLVAKGAPLHVLTRHILGLYQGCPGGKLFRRFLSENVRDAGSEVLVEALEMMRARTVICA